MAVARERLLNEWFDKFVAEAREIWKGQGNGWIGLTNKQLKSNRKKYYYSRP